MPGTGRWVEVLLGSHHAVTPPYSAQAAAPLRARPETSVDAAEGLGNVKPAFSEHRHLVRGDVINVEAASLFTQVSSQNTAHWAPVSSEQECRQNFRRVKS